MTTGIKPVLTIGEEVTSGVKTGAPKLDESKFGFPSDKPRLNANLCKNKVSLNRASWHTVLVLPVNNVFWSRMHTRSPR